MAREAAQTAEDRPSGGFETAGGSSHSEERAAADAREAQAKASADLALHQKQLAEQEKQLEANGAPGAEAETKGRSVLAERTQFEGPRSLPKKAAREKDAHAGTKRTAPVSQPSSPNAKNRNCETS